MTIRLRPNANGDNISSKHKRPADPAGIIPKRTAYTIQRHGHPALVVHSDPTTRTASGQAAGRSGNGRVSKSSGNREQRVDIYLHFIGQFDAPIEAKLDGDADEKRAMTLCVVNFAIIVTTMLI